MAIGGRALGRHPKRRSAGSASEEPKSRAEERLGWAGASISHLEREVHMMVGGSGTFVARFQGGGIVWRSLVLPTYRYLWLV